MLDIGVIGVGNMGQNHARILSDMKGVDNVYIYDSSHDRADEIAKRCGAKTVSSLDALFSTVNAVTIATPTSTHFDVARAALEHGVHTLVEKPICKTRKQAKELCNMAKAFPDLVCGVGHVERFNPAAVYTLSSIQNPHYIGFTRHNPGSDRITDTTVVEDLMIHDIDLITAYIAPKYKDNPIRIHACGDKNTFVAILDSGFPIVISASRNATKKTRTIYVEDSDMTYVADLVDQSVNVYHKPNTYNNIATGSFVTRINLQRIEPLMAELVTFVKCIREKQPFPISFLNGCANILLCDAILGHNQKSTG